MDRWRRLMLMGAVVTLLYTITSALVVINGFVWLPGMPTVWYDVEAALYWPFKPYFGLMFAWLARSDLPYWAYALLTRIPFLLAPPLLVRGALRRQTEREKATGGAVWVMPGDSGE